MINKDRIVPVTATDLISLYSVILGFIGEGTSPFKIDPATVDGVYDITADLPQGRFAILSQPAKEIKIASTIESAAFFFVPDYNFTGVTVDGEALPSASGSDEVVPDGCSLYSADIASGTVRYIKFGF